MTVLEQAQAAARDIDGVSVMSGRDKPSAAKVQALALVAIAEALTRLADSPLASPSGQEQAR